MVCKQSHCIVCIKVAKGRKHDFRVYKESKLPLHSSLKIQGDSGYQGLQKLHALTQLPIKATKKKPLTHCQKKHNHTLASSRVKVEHVIRKLKVFNILAHPYRNRRKRFALRVNLIAGLYNYQLIK